MTNARMARWVSDVFIWIGVLGGLSVGLAVGRDDMILGVAVGFGALIQLLAIGTERPS